MNKIIRTICFIIITSSLVACSEVEFKDILSSGSSGSVPESSFLTESLSISPTITETAQESARLVLFIDDSASMQDQLNQVLDGIENLMNSVGQQNVKLEVYTQGSVVRDRVNGSYTDHLDEVVSTRTDTYYLSAPLASAEINPLLSSSGVSSLAQNNFSGSVRDRLFNTLSTEYNTLADFTDGLKSAIDSKISNASTTRNTNPEISCGLSHHIRKMIDDGVSDILNYIVIADEEEESGRRCQGTEVVETKNTSISYPSYMATYKYRTFDHMAVGEGGVRYRSSGKGYPNHSSLWVHGQVCHEDEINSLKQRFGADYIEGSCRYTQFGTSAVAESNVCGDLMSASGVSSIREVTNQADKNRIISAHNMTPDNVITVGCYTRTRQVSELVKHEWMNLESGNVIEAGTAGAPSIPTGHGGLLNLFDSLSGQYNKEKIHFTPIVLTDLSDARNIDQEVGQHYLSIASKLQNSEVISVNESDYGNGLSSLKTFVQKFYSEKVGLEGISNYILSAISSSVKNVYAHFGPNKVKVNGYRYTDMELIIENTDEIEGADLITIDVEHYFGESDTE